MVLNASCTAVPAAPPFIASGPVANLNIAEKISGNLVILRNTMMIHPAMYIMDMNGISFSETAAILLNPPMRMSAIINISTTPIIQLIFGTPKSSSLSISARKVDWKLMVILLI